MRKEIPGKAPPPPLTRGRLLLNLTVSFVSPAVRGGVVSEISLTQMPPLGEGGASAPGGGNREAPRPAPSRRGEAGGSIHALDALG